jgi:hypothetical protein
MALQRPRLVLYKLVFSGEWTQNEIDILLEYKLAKPVIHRLYEDHHMYRRRTVCIFNHPPPETVLDVVERTHTVTSYDRTVTKKKCWGYVYLA